MSQARPGELLAAFPGKTVLIIGDVMLDEYVWGQVRRISPEAPVPVVEAFRRTYAPGGAGNVAANVASLGGRALLSGVVGSDYPATKLRDVLQENNVLSDGLVVENDRPTTTKTRIVAHSQQVVRVDSELRAPLPDALENALLNWMRDHIETTGACVLSDYDKGTVSSRLAQGVIGLARRHGRPVIVDPKGADYSKYRGATVITPNISEAERAVGREIRNDEDVITVGKLLIEQLEGSSVLMTRGAEGMSLLSPDTSPIHIPTVARSVYDVTGAGDTVVSALALALAVGASLEQAARLSNQAAGIVVGKLGTARVRIEELQTAVNGEEA